MSTTEDLIRAAFGAGFDLATDEPLLSRRDFTAKFDAWRASVERPTYPVIVTYLDTDTETEDGDVWPAGSVVLTCGAPDCLSHDGFQEYDKSERMNDIDASDHPGTFTIYQGDDYYETTGYGCGVGHDVEFPDETAEWGISYF